MVGDEAFVRVKDNGRGINSTVLPRVFDMFVQERTTSDGKGGLGLGLGLVKKLIDLHGGTVAATSDGEGKGATFEVRLPVSNLQIASAYQAPRTDTSQHEKRLRAVVCDDAPDLRELVADLLRMKGHEVTVVEDGPSAVRVISLEKPDVALIDIGLPDMDGYE